MTELLWYDLTNLLVPLILHSLLCGCLEASRPRLGHVNMYPWKHLPLDVDNSQFWHFMMGWTRPGSDLLKNIPKNSKGTLCSKGTCSHLWKTAFRWRVRARGDKPRVWRREIVLRGTTQCETAFAASTALYQFSYIPRRDQISRNVAVDVERSCIARRDDDCDAARYAGTRRGANQGKPPVEHYSSNAEVLQKRRIM